MKLIHRLLGRRRPVPRPVDSERLHRIYRETHRQVEESRELAWPLEHRRVTRVELERLDAEHVPREVQLPLGTDDGVPSANDVHGPLDCRRRARVRRLAAEPARKVGVLVRDLQLPNRVGGIGVVGAPELVAEARVAEARDEDAVPTCAGDERREEDMRVSLDERNRESAQGVADDDVGCRHHCRVLLDTGRDVLARQIRRVDDVSATLEFGAQRVPEPAAAPRAVHERERSHATILACG
jgi:hypothetical protein